MIKSGINIDLLKGDLAAWMVKGGKEDLRRRSAASAGFIKFIDDASDIFDNNNICKLVSYLVLIKLSDKESKIVDMFKTDRIFGYDFDEDVSGRIFKFSRLIDYLTDKFNKESKFSQILAGVDKSLNVTLDSKNGVEDSIYLASNATEATEIFDKGFNPDLFTSQSLEGSSLVEDVMGRLGAIDMQHQISEVSGTPSNVVSIRGDGKSFSPISPRFRDDVDDDLKPLTALVDKKGVDYDRGNIEFHI